jgi:simple sugar transport system ATP-binding protein
MGPAHDADTPLLELRGITKRFGRLTANDDISLRLDRGEVVGLLGENGAGKSTLMNVLSGLIQPDQGDIYLTGKAVSFASPRDAVAAGIGMVHQHFMLVPTLSVIENIALGDRSLRLFPLDLSGIRDRLAEVSNRVGLEVDPDATVGRLGVGEQQRVEIARVLCHDARILILDEPTAVLTPEESTQLFEAVRSMAAAGTSVILISHKLDDIFGICSRVAVLRQGRKVLDAPLDQTDRDALVQAMVGDTVSAPHGERVSPPGAPIVTVKNLRLKRDSGATVVVDLNAEVRSSEILGVAGIEGNGQRELAECIAGLRRPDAGEISYDGEPIYGSMTPRQLRQMGLRHITEDRHGTGILPAQPLSENHLLGHIRNPRFNRRSWLQRHAAKEATASIIDQYDVRAAGTKAPMGSLSGGNQQKAVLGRELAKGIRFLIAAHPTRGLDIRTIAFIQRQLLDLRDAGVGILLISSDLNEIWRLSDTILVFGGGKAFGPVSAESTSLPEVGAWMAGHQ